MTHLLLALSGVDRELLARTPRETAKFVGVGGAVLMTAVMAGLSAGYALYVSLGAPLPVVLVLGLLWGTGILNLDRWIVAATKRQGTWWRDIAMVLPRLLLAVVIGAVISEPLVLRIFASEIEVELRVMNAEQQAAFETQLVTDPRYVDLGAKEQEVRRIQLSLAQGVPAGAATSDPQVTGFTEELERVNASLAKAEAAVACEGLGTCGSGNAGAGPVFEANVAARNGYRAEKTRLEAQLVDARSRATTRANDTFAATEATETTRLAQLTDEVTASRAAREREVAENARRVDGADGLLNRIEALHRLVDDSAAMAQARAMLFLFILLIECMPVLVKLLMNLAKPSSYELLAQAEDDADHATATLRLDTAAEEARMQAEVALDAAEVRARSELDAHLGASRALLDAQVEVVRRAALAWRAEQLESLVRTPELFFDVPVQRSPGASHQGGSLLGGGSQDTWQAADEAAFVRAAWQAVTPKVSLQK